MFPSFLLAGKWDGNYFAKFSMDTHARACQFPIPLEMKLTIKNGRFTGNILNKNISNTNPCCSSLNAGRIEGTIGSNGNITSKVTQGNVDLSHG